MRISDWSSDVCSSDLMRVLQAQPAAACSATAVAKVPCEPLPRAGLRLCRSRSERGWEGFQTEMNAYLSSSCSRADIHRSKPPPGSIQSPGLSAVGQCLPLSAIARCPVTYRLVRTATGPGVDLPWLVADPEGENVFAYPPPQHRLCSEWFEHRSRQNGTTHQPHSFGNGAALA